RRLALIAAPLLLPLLVVLSSGALRWSLGGPPLALEAPARSFSEMSWNEKVVHLDPWLVGVVMPASIVLGAEAAIALAIYLLLRRGDWRRAGPSRRAFPGKT